MSAEVDLELDCRGQRCPLPVIRLAQEIGAVPTGGVVAVVTGDAAAGPDLVAWCRMRQHEYVGSDAADDGTPRHLVRRLV